MQSAFTFFVPVSWQNRALSKGLLLELMSSGTELFCKERYAEAAEYFTEVKRLAPGLQIEVPLKAHLHLAMCFEKRVS